MGEGTETSERPWPRWPVWTSKLDRPGRTPAWRRTLRFTKVGRWYCGLTLGIGLAALNTGNNLLFLVLGLLLGGIIVSGVLSENAVQGVWLERRLPRSASVGEPTLVGLVARRSGRFPAFSLELREAGGEVRGAAYLLVLPPGAEREVSYRFTPERRGLHRLERLEVATRSPFGLFEKARPLDAPAQLVVFPRAVQAAQAVLVSSGREGEKPEQRTGQGQELHGLRDHRPGEDVRAVHWRSSARAARLIAVERERERRTRVCLLLDQRGLVGLPLERAVEETAALFVRALEEGAEVALSVSGQLLGPGSGQDHLLAGLTLLALLAPAPAQAPAPQRPAGLALLSAGGREAA